MTRNAAEIAAAPEVLAPLFRELAGRYSADAKLADKLWQELAQAYENPRRHYHTLAHLAALVQELAPFRGELTDPDTVLFALFYHDAVYEARRADNEERSAELAAARLTQLQVPAAQIGRCRTQILATKRHEPSGDADTDLLTDADLAVLGQPWPAYERYTRQVRAEYKIYPDLLYRPGRRKVLRHFLDKPRIYKTPPFSHRYEAAARANLERELGSL